jgi:outer membrane protein TolC
MNSADKFGKFWLAAVVAVLFATSAQAQDASPNVPPDAYGLPITIKEEPIPLELPKSSQLLPVSSKLPPIKLEASYTQPISLRDALRYALDNNLPIRIQQEVVSSQKWLFGSALGGFLPNVLMSYRQSQLAGTSLVGGLIPTTANTSNVNTGVQFQQYLFRGGRVLFGSLQNLNQYKAARQGLNATIRDTLLAITRDYYNLVANEALLQIQVSAVETARAQLDLNQKLERGGVGTHFAVLQSETQLATEEQNLLGQEVALRNSAMQLAADLNINMGVNFLPAEHEVKKVRLIDPTLNINQLINVALVNRPELKQFNYLRLAARRNIQVQAAPLYPSLFIFGNITGSGATLGPSSRTSPASFQAIPLAAPAAGPPLRGPGTTGGGGGSSTIVAAGERFVPPSTVSTQIRKSTAYGFQIDWNYNNLGVPDLANVQAARAQARQVTLQANQQLIFVTQQVRQSYLNSEIAERQVDVARKAVVSSTEQLRLSIVRLSNGVGTNIDVLQATQAWTQARTNLVNAVIQFNIAQAQLLRDIGLISFDTMTAGRLVRQ